MDNARKSRKLGIRYLDERSSERGELIDLLQSLLNICQKEIVMVAYSADRFVENNKHWIIQALDSGKYVGLLLLQPDALQQAEQTEQRDIAPQIQKTLGYCKSIVDAKPERASFLKARGHNGHFYYTGAFADCSIVQMQPPNHVLSDSAFARVQLKANFMSQHEGLVLTFAGNSRYGKHYVTSCRTIWNHAKELSLT